MAVEGDKKLKKSKRLPLLDEEREKVTMVPGHLGIPRNEIVDKEAKAALEYDLLATEKYPTQDLINWIEK
jgi:ribonuclease HI